MEPLLPAAESFFLLGFIRAEEGVVSRTRDGRRLFVFCSRIKEVNKKILAFF